MQGVEIGHCNAAIKAVLTANYTILGSAVQDVLETVSTYGKKDTLCLDARPEIDVVQIMKRHDDNSVVITEEIGSKGNLVFSHTEDPRTSRTIYICDPTDRSVFLKKFSNISMNGSYIKVNFPSSSSAPSFLPFK